MLGRVFLAAWVGIGFLSLVSAVRADGGASRGSAVPDDWMAKASTEAARSEYRFSEASAGVWSAPNRAHDLRTRVEKGRVEVTSRTRGSNVEGGGWLLKIGFSRLAFDGDPLPSVGVPAEPEVASSGDRVELRRDIVTEWYVNDERGLEQGLTIARPPRETRGAISPDVAPRLAIDLAVEGDLLVFASEDGGEILFKNACAVPVLRYTGLQVTDASGRALPARLEAGAGTIRILIDERGAAYPLTVDPLLTSPSWFAESDQAMSNFGFSVATAGDVNGDGYSDVIASAFTFDNGQTDEGRVYVYMGSASGLSTTAAWTAEIDWAGAFFGVSVASAGDVNGDGYGDVIIGAFGLSNSEAGEGAALAWLGGPTGLGPNGTIANVDWFAESNQAGAQFGRCVMTAGDVNGDGYSDVIVGAPLYDSGQADEGAAFVWLGSASGLGVTGTPVNAAWRAESNQANAQMGFSLSTAGDVNGDGYADVIVGANLYDNGLADEGSAFLWLGSASGLGANGTPVNADWSAESNQTAARFGIAVALAGDVNGDGYGDVIVGAAFQDQTLADEGLAFVYLGSSSGLATTAAWNARGSQAGAIFGYSVGTAGDVNGDGYGDVIVGAYAYTNGQLNEGKAFVWMGGPLGLGANGVPGNATWSAESNQAGAQLGVSVATAGDVNGDGYSDVITGAFTYDNGQTDEGRAYAYYGSAAGISASPSMTATGDQTSAHFGSSVGAGDFNGDGYSDLLVGAPLYDNGETNEGRAFLFPGSSSGPSTTPSWTAEVNKAAAQFGSRVSDAGDVNGDGYGDILVGAPNYDTAQQGGGRAYLYLGSPSGPGGSPAWFAESNVLFAQLGLAVGSAGDVDSDGFGDVIIGAPGIGSGAAYVYKGSASGLSATALWTAMGSQSGEEFGLSVAGAGDVNGDGYSDVIVGAPYYDVSLVDEGGSFVYLGSTSGPSLTPAWKAAGGQAGAHFGSSVGGAGDVNGDGYGDVLIGAPFFSTTAVESGAVLAWFGSAAGLGPDGDLFNADWTDDYPSAGAHFGGSVASAGDMNDDGYSDIVVAAPAYYGADPNNDYGAVRVYMGSVLGPATLPAVEYVGALHSHLGSSVAAGDMNGDGFSDLVVGARLDDTSFTDAGKVSLFFGNATAGRPRLARQARSDNTAPVHLLGLSDSQTAFRVKALGRSAGGRARVRLVWEVKPLGLPLDGSGLRRGSIQDSGAPTAAGSAVTLDELADGLTLNTAYHWRLRTTNNSPFFPSSPWISPPGNGRNETDIRTRGICADADGDGYGLPGSSSCAGGAQTDCNDANSAIHPGAAETCNLVDDNCDGQIDEGNPGGGASCSTGSPGVCGAGTITCSAGSFVCVQNVQPSAEVCDGLDNDCNNLVDDDSDGDGAGACADCNNLNPSLIAIPTVLQGLTVQSIPGGQEFTWTSQAGSAGSATVYDAYLVSLSAPISTSQISAGMCISENLGTAVYDYTGPDPPPGTAYYFMFRGQNACPGGTGSYGDAGRDAAVAAGANACQ